MSIKQELREYYAKQGLTGKHLRKALQWDMKAVARNKERWNPGRALSSAFVWGESPQGHAYWMHRAECTGK